MVHRCVVNTVVMWLHILVVSQTVRRTHKDTTNFMFFYVLLTVHLDAILGNDQLDALFLNVFIYASTYFEQQMLIIRRAKLY
jgi:predicted nucleotide-binding protein (sugar kinase/HSP70/actin superfamily)